MNATLLHRLPTMLIVASLFWTASVNGQDAQVMIDDSVPYETHAGNYCDGYGQCPQPREAKWWVRASAVYMTRESPDSLRFITQPNGTDAFNFVAPDGATEMSEDALAELDELPPGLAPGETK